MKHLGLFSAILLLLPVGLHAQYSDVNQHLQLSGSGYISVPHSQELNYPGRLAIDAWVFPAQAGSPMAVIGNDQATGYWFGLSPQGKVRFKPNPSTVQESTGNVPLNTWTHIAVAYDPESGSTRIYINGNLDRLINAQTFLGWSYNDLRIGADRAGNLASDYWIGRLDEVRIWDAPINFATASGSLYRIPHAVDGGLYGTNLLAVWRLNGDAHDPVGPHSGTLTGNGTWMVDPDPPHYPRIGVSFRNSTIDAAPMDYLSIPYYQGIPLHGSFTIECWVKPSASGGHPSFQTILSKTTSTVALLVHVWLGINKTNDRIRFSPNGDAQDVMESDRAVPEGQWSHVVARFQPSGNRYLASLFIDGLAAGQKFYTTPGTQAQVPIVLGNTWTSPNMQTTYGYSGLLDELRLWVSPRSDAEIADSYRREIDEPVMGLAGNYHFDGDVLDAAGGGRHGDNHYPRAEWYFYQTTDLPAEPTLDLIAPAGGERWAIGGSGTLRWSGIGLHAATLELSRDDGATWGETLVANGAASGIETWTVTGPATTNARVRVRTLTPTPLEDVSGAFEIVEPPPVLSVDPTSIVMTISSGMPLPPLQLVHIRNIGGGTLYWTATDEGSSWLAIDPPDHTGNDDTLRIGLATTIIPPGSYSETVTIGGNAVNHGLLIAVRLTVTSKKIYGVAGRLMDVTGAGIDAIPVHATGELSRTGVSDTTGHYELPDLPSGDYVVAPQSFYYTSDPMEKAFTPLNNFEPSVHFTLTKSMGVLRFRYREGWNLISLPLVPDEPDVATYLPDAQMPVFAWDSDSGYVRRWQLEPFTAYWVKFARTDSVLLRGRLERDLLLHFDATESGWNMIGMPSGPCALDDVVTTPVGMLRSTYEYDPVFGYLPPVDGMLVPGKGMFVKIDSGGSMRIRGREEEHASPARQFVRYPAALRQ
ncbi:MAG: LamG-like jellyroll fold domain-containing protein [Bacteroidota bacterium]|jgi:hypothetical protein|nr:LamG-like jellyroll fold domain-containing protein [Bacteroidota bacterium]